MVCQACDRGRGNSEEYGPVPAWLTVWVGAELHRKSPMPNEKPQAGPAPRRLESELGRCMHKMASHFTSNNRAKS